MFVERAGAIVGETHDNVEGDGMRQTRQRRWFLYGALIAMVGVGFPTGPAAATASVVRVSGQSPFATNECRPVDEPAWGTFDEQAGHETDPSVAVNPSNPANVVAAWPQDAGYGLVAAASFDGGQTWTRTVVPGMTRCTGGTEDHILHARLSFGPDGRVYLAGETLDGFFPDPRSGLNHIPVATSTDGGLTWNPAVRVDDLPAISGFDRLAAEPDVPGAAVVVWHGPETAAASYVSRTIDGGRTWVKHEVPVPVREFQPIQSVLSAPDGGLYVFYADQTLLDTVMFIGSVFGAPTDSRTTNLFALRSDDKGASWSGPYSVAANVPAESVGTATGPDGTLYISTWRDGAGGRELVVLRSHDRGATWSAPSVVATGVVAPFPSVAATPDGALGMTYSQGSGNGDVEAVFARSIDGGLTWEHRHVAGPFPAGRYGFYQETAAAPDAFYSVFIRGGDDTDGPTDVYVARNDAPAS